MINNNLFYAGNKTKYPVKTAAVKYEHGEKIILHFENYITGEKKIKEYKTLAAARRGVTMFFKSVNANNI